MIPMQRIIPVSLLLGLACSLSQPAHAALFSDDEARRAILEVRVKTDAQSQQIEALESRLQKAEASLRGQFELVNQLEQLRQENAKLRGQLETLTKELADTQRRQKDLFVDLENRLVKMEPQTVNIDGKDTRVDQKEALAYESAQGLFKNGDFKAAITALTNFQKTYPNSAYSANAVYWLGNSHYALRDYKQAIATQQSLIKTYPDNPKAADAMLNIASSQLELNDKKAARKTLETIISNYPKAPAATAAKERLATLK